MYDDGPNGDDDNDAEDCDHVNDKEYEQNKYNDYETSDDTGQALMGFLPNKKVQSKH